MNKKMSIIKKRLLNVCSKLIQSTNTPTAQQQVDSTPEPIKKIKRHSNRILNRKTFSVISKANSYSSALSSVSSISRSESKNKSKKTSASSGYGTSIKSTMSVFMNLDNYFYDENFNNNKIKDTKQTKLDIIQELLDFQQEFIDELKTNLENHVRPLSAVMNPKLYLEIFQNIEKIFTATTFVRNSINESMLLTQDLYTSTITIINEYIQIIVNAYEFYLTGYAQSSSSISDKEFVDLLEIMNKSTFMYGFDLINFIDLPIKNISKIYCTFMSLLELTPIQEEHDFERLTNICAQIKKLIEPRINQSSSFEASSVSLLHNDISLFNSILDNNLFKKKSNDNTFNFKTNQHTLVNKNRKTRKCRSAKKSIRSPTSIPNDFTGFDGTKYYFV